MRAFRMKLYLAADRLSINATLCRKARRTRLAYLSFNGMGA